VPGTPGATDGVLTSSCCSARNSSRSSSRESMRISDGSMPPASSARTARRAARSDGYVAKKLHHPGRTRWLRARNGRLLRCANAQNKGDVMSELVRLEVDEGTGVGTIRLDRPKMNAINEEVTEGLAEAAREATFNDKIKAVVLWGGEKIFAAGADIKMM